MSYLRNIISDQTTITTAPIRFKARPSRAICLTVSKFEPKIIAFGPVATGYIKAKLALMAAGTINSWWSISAWVAAAAKIGINRLLVAVLLVTSVRKVTAKQISVTISRGGN